MNSQWMNINNFYAKGSDLWFLEQNPSGQLFQKLDWYTHFILNKSLEHKSQKAGEKIEKIVFKSNLSLNFSDTSKVQAKPILIPSRKWLPCDWLVLLSTYNEKSWLEQIQEQSKNLKSYRLRIFVKSSTEAEILQKKLNLGPDSNLTFVTEI